ncbi:hypothetical protein ABB37_01718 [Leptomonas pyrrhocoris]|uniref:Ubiquitin-like domain-containing protein n=1 Tax=Leptomonas pyrrhocoris TaxID=157538 RepID=A0A0M9G9K0_LEPPY|nr:hypothetical protein ABB37_01718 [Leptomonas pyrrhocoris]KPA85409.1 hypothetical protein ABB37_01718 [Leptomonas pyrrhocoris]|eukprot:XP_015663848.1 hypothetical protein ABB37_01718 [Leptomonas pyrrhocoris]
MATKKEFYVDFEVKFGKTIISVEMPASASVHDLKKKLEEQTHVSAEKQRLLLNLPVMKEKHRDPPHDTLLRHLFPAALVERCEQHEGHIAQHLKVSSMLLGSAEGAPTVNVAATTEISRLVATTVEHDGKWYRCSYSRGYLRQTAYVCRTCINAGRADPQHALCLACAEFCHGDHEVEEWGVRHYMRCDCCTEKCWRSPTALAGGGGHSTSSPEKAAENGVTTTADSADAAATNAAEVHAVHTRDIEQRTMRKRPRSTSPLTPKRSRGNSPMSGIRMTTIPPAEMPELDLQPTSTASTARSSHGPAGEASCTVVGLSVQSAAPTDAFPSAPQRALTDAVNTTPDKKSATEGISDVSGAIADSPPPLPPLSRCAFVIDSKTNRAPVESILPTNHHNRYPRDPLNWCYCKMLHPSDDPECGGIACLLCASCFWSTHITKLFTGQYRRMPCYGDVLVGDTVAFKCNTCRTYVCTPCRYRCHKDHDIAPCSVIPSAEDGTDNGAIAGANFSCGCRGLCAIAETVPEELIDDPSTYTLISDADAMELINNDVFTGFLCAHCMQEHPWLVTEDPLKCYHGDLPAPVQTRKPVLGCGTKASSPTRTIDNDDTDTFPYHGMLMPVNSFTPDMTCGCAPCRAAYEKFAPRALEDAAEMIMELHDRCDNCGASVKDQQAFMCRTCEMNMDDTFFLCKDCNALRQMLVANCNRVQSAPGPSAAVGDVLRDTAEAENATSRPQATAASQEVVSAEVEATQDGHEAASNADGYTHDLSHEFIEDTFEDLYALCEMQMLRTMDPEMREYVTSNWTQEATQAEVANTLSKTLGQIPLQFNDEELREMASLNQRRKQSQNKQQ